MTRTGAPGVREVWCIDMPVARGMNASPFTVVG